MYVLVVVVLILVLVLIYAGPHLRAHLWHTTLINTDCAAAVVCSACAAAIILARWPSATSRDALLTLSNFLVWNPWHMGLREQPRVFFEASAGSQSLLGDSKNPPIPLYLLWPSLVVYYSMFNHLLYIRFFHSTLLSPTKARQSGGAGWAGSTPHHGFNAQTHATAEVRSVVMQRNSSYHAFNDVIKYLNRMPI